jgi:HlyD family secretion protein
MTIANPDSILTEVNVDEADIATIAPGQRARIYAIAYPDKPVDGEVTSIAVSAKVAEGQQGLSFAVKIKLLDRAQITLRPGMSCRAEIFSASRENVLAVPIQAIRVEEDMTRNETRRYAFVDRDGTAKRIAVEVGLSDDTYQEITGGLDAGDSVIIGPDRVLRALRDGDHVTVKKDER